MDLVEYQRGALRTAAPRDKKNELLHLVLGLVGESGEIAEKFKKWICAPSSPGCVSVPEAPCSGQRSVNPVAVPEHHR